MTTSSTSVANEATRMAPNPCAGCGLAIVRVTIGAMLVSVFFENLGKGLYHPAGYAGLINYYITNSHSPALWKSVMGLAASHARMAAPMQGLTEISLGVLLVIGPVHTTGRHCGFSVSRQPVDFGVGHRVDLGAAGSGDRLARARDRTRGPKMGCRRVAGTRVAIVPVVVMDWKIADPARASVRHHPYP